MPEQETVPQRVDRIDGQVTALFAVVRRLILALPPETRADVLGGTNADLDFLEAAMLGDTGPESDEMLRGLQNSREAINAPFPGEG